MNDTTSRYRRRPAEIEAIQWTGGNADALRAFAGSDFDTIDPEDRIEDPDQDAQLLVEASHWVGIKPTDWVLKFEGYFVAKRDETFRDVWEPAPAAGLVPAADRAALAEDLRYALTHREPGHDHEQPGVWDGSGMQCGHCARLAVARGNLAAYDAGPDAVLPAPADRAADVAQHVTRAIFALKSPAPAGSEHYRSGWDDGLEAAMDATRHAVLRRMADETPPAEAEPTPDEPTVRATRYLVTCVPEHRDPGGYRGVTVEYRGDERWAVLHYVLCLGTDGRWDRERQSSERDEEWLATHRFDLATAQRLAEEQAKDLVRPAKDHRPTAPAQPGKEA